MSDEFARIDWLKSRFELQGGSEGLLVGIGDDAAVINFGSRPTIVTVDTQVEGVHFRRDLLSPRELGYRAMVAAVSDVWAMGAMPSASVVALTIPASESDEGFRQLIDGLAEAARATGARVIGGNLSQGQELSVTTTVFGLPIADSLTREGATPGDAVYVTGTLGASALGFAILAAGGVESEAAARFVERWKRPPLNGRWVKGLAEIATAAVDVSDGCLQDLQHLTSASNVGAVVQAEALPTAPGHEALCERLGLDPVALALSGGEDYELIFTAAESSEAAALGTRIGEIVDGAGVRVLDSNGDELTLDRRGYRHFS
jgi:thiamine-monophosphate kinase